MNMLAIDTSTQTMGVALLKENKIVAEMTLLSKNDHSSRLMPAIHDVMEQAKVELEMLNAIVVTNGPGSYTGTRIGITTAKTMAWALDIPVKTVSSLKLIASSNSSNFTGLICPFIDARRGTVYTGLYRWSQGELIKEKDEVNILFASWLDMLKNSQEPILFLSSDILAFKQQIEDACTDAVIPYLPFQQIHPSHLFTLADTESNQAVHEIVPNYLRKTEAETKWMEQQQQEREYVHQKQQQDTQQQRQQEKYRQNSDHQNSEKHQQNLEHHQQTELPQQPKQQQQTKLQQQGNVSEDSIHG